MQLDSRECLWLSALLNSFVGQLLLDSFGKALQASWREEQEPQHKLGDWLALKGKELQTIKIQI